MPCTSMRDAMQRLALSPDSTAHRKLYALTVGSNLLVIRMHTHSGSHAHAPHAEQPLSERNKAVVTKLNGGDIRQGMHFAKKSSRAEGRAPRGEREVVGGIVGRP